jgi:ATP-dependent DNA helicase RecG
VFLRELKQPVAVLRGAGKSVVQKLARMGIVTVADLLGRYPRDYDDRTRSIPFAGFAAAEKIHTQALVLQHEWFGYGRMRTLKIVVEDDSARAVLVCFNRAFLEQQFPVGSRVLVTGKFQQRYGEIQSSSFDIESLEEGAEQKSGLVPVYALTAGLAQGTVRKLEKIALGAYGNRVEDELPASLVEGRALLHKAQALGAMHFPDSAEDRRIARETLAYEELFFFQLAVARRSSYRRQIQTTRKASTGLLEKRLRERLPFELTPDQDRSCAEIVQDMARPHPMARLLQGDVGSGKTLVALIACLHAVESGGQAAILAPTELLARQHAATTASLLEPLGLRLAFLSGTTDDGSRREVLAALASGSLDIVLGTHALFSEDVAFKNLKLAIVDEQHRFGVLQRVAMGRKGDMPDLLMMTATPIPRTLALTVYGDLAVSTIRTMPPGRKPIVTHLATTENASKVYDFVRKLVVQGRQAYFVYPLIEGSEKSDLKDAQSMAEELASRSFAGISVGLIHSKLKEAEKRETMDGFVKGSIRILVATSVVEVGVDVPNAAAMVVEHAERFGLAALHQLRGRVGRGSDQSYCFLVYGENPTEDAKARLKAMLASSDGFVLAEEDLRIRGPGEITGTAQAGALRLAVADPVRDVALLEKARADAFHIIEDDPGLLLAENLTLREVLERAPPFGEGNRGPGL